RILGLAAAGTDLAGVANLRNRRVGADAQCGGAGSDRLGSDRAGVRNAARDAHRVATAADHEAIAVDAGIDAVAQNAAFDDQAEVVAAACDRPDRDVAIFRADHHGRRFACGNDGSCAFLGVGNAVLVLVGIVRGVAFAVFVLTALVFAVFAFPVIFVVARLAGRRGEYDAAGHVTFDDERRSALELVVGIELRGIGGRRGIAVAGRGDLALYDHRAIDVAAEVSADRAFALGDHLAGQPHVAGDILRADGNRVAAEHAGLAVVREIAGQRPTQRNAGRIVAF